MEGHNCGPSNEEQRNKYYAYKKLVYSDAFQRFAAFDSRFQYFWRVPQRFFFSNPVSGGSPESDARWGT